MASVRARRPPSPPPLGKGIPPTAAVAAPAPRFPPKQQQYLDADARRANASTRSRPRRRSAPGGLNLARAEWNLLVGVLIVGAAVRLFRISKPDSVVFDEVHFGKFAARYIKTRYFVDVHPPLAKLLITLAGFLFGFDGGFEFEDIAKPFPTDVPYVAMRMLPALMGLWTVPLGYMTLRMLDVRATSALLASTLLIFDNALVTQSRHILLDAPLVFFTALTIFFWVGFGNEDKERPFGEGWWAWLVLTGLSLGAVVSCKWVGLFTIATVGLGTLSQLWTLLGDTRVPPRLWLKHLLARALCLIVLPILFYMFMFQIHFAVLQNSGEGDGFMSPEFQHTLGGHRMVDTYADVVVGSEVTIRHVNTNGGYLHSHAHNYPTGSRQQHVTLYPHIDDNNNWRIVNATSAGDPYSDWAGIVPVQHIVDGARVKIRHIATDRSLHSHDYRPPVSEVEFQNEVSAYGMAGFEGDANDDWIVEIDATASADRISRKRLRTLRTVFKLKHPLTGCYLFSHKVKLPAWGFDQQEVTCNKNAVRANSLWMVETNSQPNLPLDAPKVNYRTPGFIEKFLELNSVMWTTNAGLTERHTFDSRPSSWPVLRRGINFWVKDHRQIYLTGNPFVWWLSTAAVMSYVAVRALLILRAKRGFHDFENSKVVKYDTLCGFLFIAWSLHYLPFFLMSRQLFLHHYLPALYFAVLLAAAVFDFMAAALKPVYRLGLAAVLAVVVVWNFAVFSPLAYGLPWTRDKCQAAQWRKTWDFSCSDFHTDYAKYAIDAHATPVGGQAAVQPQAPPAVATIEAGRGVPVVVNVNDHQLSTNDTDAEETQVERGKAEPGRDIFGAGAGGGKEAVVMPSSAAVQVGRKVDEGAKEEEEVEKIVVDAGKVVPQDGKVDEGAKVEKEAGADAEKAVGGADAKPPVVESVKQQQQQQQQEQEQQKLATSEEEHVKLYTAPAGPKGHEDTEADEVRDELFPGEAKA